MKKYFVITECGDIFIHETKATNRAEALKEAIYDFCGCTRSEQKDGRAVYAAEAEDTNEDDFNFDSVTWTGYVSGGGWWCPSLENEFAAIPSDYVAARYDEAWSWDEGVSDPSFCEFLRLVATALDYKWHEIAYIDEESDYCDGEFHIDSML